MIELNENAFDMVSGGTVAPLVSPLITQLHTILATSEGTIGSELGPDLVLVEVDDLSPYRRFPLNTNIIAPTFVSYEPF